MEYKIGIGNHQVLGVSKWNKGLSFSLVVKKQEECSLILYKKGTDVIAYEIPFTGAEVRKGQVYARSITGIDFVNYDYNYKIGGKIEPDPYAKIITSNKGQTVCSFSLEEYNWEVDELSTLDYEDIIMYGLHVKGFTKQAQGVKYKGTFLGIIEKIPYMKELGINYIEMMPAYNFNDKIMPLYSDYRINPVQLEEGKSNYWGYGHGAYFSVKESYCATKNPVKEFKDLVKALHANGIGIIMEFHFTKLVTQGYILDCLKYWAFEFHVDGFHLTGEKLPLILIAEEPLLADRRIIADGFPISEIYEKEEKIENRQLAASNDEFKVAMRKVLKGDDNQISSFLHFNRRIDEKYGSINYIANHNGFTLADLVSYDRKHNEANGEDNRDGNDFNFSWNCGVEGPTRKMKIMATRLRQMKNALALVCLSQGTPFIQAGDEFGNSQSGNNNAYSQDNEIGWLDWKQLKKTEELFHYTKQLIAIRKANPILHMPQEPRLMDWKSYGYPDLSYHGERAWYGNTANISCNIGLMYFCRYGEEQSNKLLYIAYNFDWNTQDFALPTLKSEVMWKISMDTDKSSRESLERKENEELQEEQKSITVPPRSIVILTGEMKLQKSRSKK